MSILLWLMSSLVCLAPMDEDVTLESASKALQEGHWSEAITRFETLREDKSLTDDGAKFVIDRLVYAYYRRGIDHFHHGRAEEAIKDFDREIELDPSRDPHHWQRGLAYYYAGEFQKGGDQFTRHRTVNPDDVENAVWHFLCAVKAPGGSIESARKNLIPIQGDGRVPMKEVHALFAGERTIEEVLAVAEKEGSPSAQFYADLYVGLYLDAVEKKKEALPYFERAAKNRSFKGQTMGDVPELHLRALKAELSKAEK